jgi:hypothetical protein
MGRAFVDYLVQKPMSDLRVGIPYDLAVVQALSRPPLVDTLRGVTTAEDVARLNSMTQQGSEHCTFALTLPKPYVSLKHVQELLFQLWTNRDELRIRYFVP